VVIPYFKNTSSILRNCSSVISYLNIIDILPYLSLSMSVESISSVKITLSQ
jgi:hypothetical protein